MTEEVRVVAETPLLQTATATRSNVIDQAKVESLPLSGRNPYALAYTLPGVTTQFTRESISARPFDNGGMDAISINGGVNRSNEFLLDGAPNASREGGNQGSLAFVPSPDAVQEVRVSTNTYDAQFGRTGGGVIAVSIRSGTNTLHGTSYYNHRVGQPEQQPVREQRPRHSEGRPLSLQSRLHVRRSRPGARVRRPQQDVLLLCLRGPEVGHPGLVRRARADRARARRRLLAVGRDHLRPAQYRQRRAAAVPRQPDSGQSHGSGGGEPPEVHGDAEHAARRDAEQLLLGEQLALRHLHVGHHPRRSQLRRQQPLLRPLRAQRPARNPRQERPRGRSADRRLSPSLEQRAQRGPELHDRADD